VKGEWTGIDGEWTGNGWGRLANGDGRMVRVIRSCGRKPQVCAKRTGRRDVRYVTLCYVTLCYVTLRYGKRLSDDSPRNTKAGACYAHNSGRTESNAIRRTKRTICTRTTNNIQLKSGNTCHGRISRFEFRKHVTPISIPSSDLTCLLVHMAGYAINGTPERMPGLPCPLSERVF